MAPYFFTFPPIGQYRRLLEMDGVKLRLTKGALSAIAGEAMRHKEGAHGLRAILEQATMELMFDVPSASPPVKEIVISEDTLIHGHRPLVTYQKGGTPAAAGGERCS